MIFAVIGHFRQPVPPGDSALQVEINQQLAQPSVRIVNAGYLRDAGGEPIGVLALIEVAAFEQAEAFLEASPFRRGGGFDRVQVARYDVEVGRLG